MIPDKSPIFTFSHTLRSRYSETDQMGYVYYGRYLEYFEVARTEMIRSMGYPYHTLEKQGVMLPVIESHVKYKAPLLYDDEIRVQIQLFEIPSVKLQTYYKMYTHRSDQLHALGKVVLCFMDATTRRPRRAPKEFIAQLKTAIHT